jgi:DNA-binding beta-propeller fold protein YncE
MWNLLKPTLSRTGLVALLVLLLTSPLLMYGSKKKKPAGTPPPSFPISGIGVDLSKLDTSKLVWPDPPAIPRIKWLNYFAGMKIDHSVQAQEKKKASWMDRMAGAQEKAPEQVLKEFPWQLIGPYGIAIDSKGLVYVADQKVGAVFIFNTETRDVQLIRNGYEAKFGWINGLAIDDGDRLFVSDGKLRQVIVFDANHKVSAKIQDGLVDPVGIAIDKENRFLYVVDTQQDQVLVYDADSFKLLRRLGKGGQKHSLTNPGDFAAPSNVAVDKDGNVYVTDTLNDRVEIFDADGGFISTFGKNGDGIGCFARPKGIAVDGDGHVWVADEMLDRIQIFTKDAQPLGFVGGHGNLPGQFKALVGIAVDKDNRVFTTEQYPGRMQMFRYFTDSEADAEKVRREKDAGDAHTGKVSATAGAPAEKGPQ